MRINTPEEESARLRQLAREDIKRHEDMHELATFALHHLKKGRAEDFDKLVDYRRELAS